MKNYLSLVKFSHTIFALPFAMIGYVLAILDDGDFSKYGFTLVLVILCMVFARNAAMSFNRFIDRDIDARNPRTAGREIPTGIISARNALIFVVLNAILFIATTYWINPICFYLSPVALLVILGYSYTKRITYLCHFVLGLGLSLAPVGAYLSVHGQFAVLPVLYGLVVLFWVAGFDIVYASQDTDIDEQLNLHSVPEHFGVEKGMRISQMLHVLVALLMILIVIIQFTTYPVLSSIHIIGTGVFLAMLWYQHSIITPTDLSRVNRAFFTANGIASVVLFSFFLIDVLIG